ncbi:MAG: hypothetical protein KJN62_09540 [Deltaproteobacteria bacterium]|nr:hypothetical protein [Deltaproteobacteria bacterium]
MPAPYDYTLRGESPIMAGLKGFDIAQQQRQRAMYMDQQRQAMEEQQRQRERQQQYRKDLMALTDNPFSSAEDYIKLQSTYPEAMEAIKQVQQGRSKEQLQGDVEQIQKVGSAMAAGKNDIAKQQIMNYRNALENSGRENEVQSMDNILEMMDENPGVVSAELNKYLLAQMGPDAFTNYFQQVAGMQRRPKQKTGAWLVKDAQDNYSIVTGSYDTATGELGISSGKLPEGYELVSALGETAAEKTQRVVEETGQKQGVVEAVKLSTKYAEQADKVSKNITTLERGIQVAEQAIKEGKTLGVGYFERKFPKIQNEFAQRMQQIGRELGLGVVSEVTFGALSEKELQLAMETGLPDYMNDEQLLQWLKDQKVAKEKLLRELDKASIFLGNPAPGHTVSDWKKQQEEIRKQQAAQRPAQPEANLTEVSTQDLINQFKGGQ